MGLIKSAISAIGGTFHDQWKEVIRCDDMNNNTLMVKKTTKTGVLTKDSTIIVAPSQLAIIYDNGRIVDATAEEGVYTFDESTSASFFAGQFGAVFKEMWERFTYGGGTSKQQAVFFFNLKEIVDNKFGTPAPIPYGDWGHPVMNARTGGYIPLSLEIKCFGKYTFKIVDPAVFMRELAGIAEVYTKEMVEDVIRTEVIGVFTNLLNSLSSEERKIEALQLPNKTDEIKKMMDEVMYDEQIRRRGLSIISFIVESVTLTDESKNKIDEYELGGDVYAQKAKLIDSYGDALKSAASNEAGAMNGFMGMGFMNMNTGNIAGGAVSGAINQQMPNGPDMQPYNQNTTPSKKCPKCGAESTGKFCSNCGTSLTEKKCPKCGTIVNGKYCSECGTNTEE